MSVQQLFPTSIYQAALLTKGATRLTRELLDEAYKIRDFDKAGQRWSKGNYPQGYTSYGSMDQLHRLSSTFMALEQHLQQHALAFAEALHWDLSDRELVLTDCWVNIMPPGCAHGLHLHPNSVISGTYYVAMPKGAPAIKFEDPRLAALMAAPQRLDSAPKALMPFVSCPAKAGEVILFESWLRHEVPMNTANEERVSISFNFGLQYRCDEMHDDEDEDYPDNDAR